MLYKNLLKIFILITIKKQNYVSSRKQINVMMNLLITLMANVFAHA